MSFRRLFLDVSAPKRAIFSCSWPTSVRFWLRNAWFRAAIDHKSTISRSGAFCRGAAAGSWTWPGRCARPSLRSPSTCCRPGTPTRSRRGASMRRPRGGCSRSPGRRGVYRRLAISFHQLFMVFHGLFMCFPCVVHWFFHGFFRGFPMVFDRFSLVFPWLSRVFHGMFDDF